MIQYGKYRNGNNLPVQPREQPNGLGKQAYLTQQITHDLI